MSTKSNDLKTNKDTPTPANVAQYVNPEVINTKDDLELALDEALRETFPASDPISVDADMPLHKSNRHGVKKS